ncbi:MAG: extracellular solute-binding protein [Clostridiales bacterium]|nr:extracellular solute-binding protein [Clostridiales bacterium]
MKRLLAIALIAMLMAAGCSNAAAPVGETPASPAAPAAVDAAAVNLTIFMDFTWLDTDQFNGIIPEEITRQTGVNLVPTKASDPMQLGVMIAGGNLPDLIYTDRMGDRLSNPDLCLPYNKLIEQYAPSFKPSDDQILVASSLSADDNYYTVLNAASSEEEWHAAKAGCPTLASLFYRRDILDELGLYPLKTLDDYVKALAVVKEKYPDMIPLTMEYTFMTDFFKTNIIPNWVPTTESMIQQDNGTIMHQTSSPEYKTYLQFMNNLYRNKYFSADNFAFTDGSQAEELLMTGKAFSMSFMTGDADRKYNQGLKDNGITGLIEQSLPLSSLRYTTPGTGWAGVYITKNNSNPEKSIQMMQWMFSPEGQKITQWGREGIEYTVDADGIPTFSDDWQKARDDGTMAVKYNPNYYFGISGVVEAVGRASGISESAKSVMNAVRSNLRTAVIPGLISPTADSPERVRMDEVSEFVKNQETKIYLSDNDDAFNANVKELYDKLAQIGLPELEAFYNQEAQKLK